MTSGIQKDVISIINCMPGNVYWFDENCAAMGCNKNVLNMLGLKSQQEFRNLGFEELGNLGGWSAEAIQSFKQDTLEVIQTGQPRLNTEEPAIPHHDGRTIYFLTNRVPLVDDAGQIIGVVGISFDITDRKLAEAQLREALIKVETLSRAKSEFITNMSHDVKTPLSGIIGMAEILTQKLHGTENLECARAILIAGQQLMNLFDNCIAIANSENADLVLNKEHFSLRKLLMELKQLFRPSIEVRRLGFSVTCDERIPEFLLGCEAGIYRILLNLIGNAVKFTHQGSIVVHVTPCERSTERQIILKIIIEDTGIGIPEDKQKVIFERFTRLLPSWQGIYEGSGIGLYIVNRFVMAMGGEIHIRSKEKKGSRFIVILPLEIPLLNPEEYATENLTSDNAPILPLPAALPSVAATTEPLNNNQHRVLLVEDNVIAQKVATSLLSSLGCQTDIADSGKQALALFEPGKYDLVLMDIGLPDFPGHTVTELTRKIEQQQGAAGVPIIALTAHITKAAKQDCLAAGMNEVLEKPLSLEKGKQIIARHLQHAAS